MTTAQSSRLTRADWLDAGLDLLREDGAAGLKLRPLLERVGLTTGSFYHHFRDISDFRDALADSYAEMNVQRIEALTGDLHGAERLTEMWRHAQELDMPRLDRAMRVWAGSSPRAAAAVEALDAHLFELVRTACLEIGFDDESARARTILILAAGVGSALVYSPWGDDTDLMARALQSVVAPG
jgi:AcrR family transcriptional regulator